MSSHSATRVCIVRMLRRWNFEGVHYGRNLGVDQTTQKVSRGARTLSKRLRKLRVRAGRVRGLRRSRKGMFRVARSGGLASATYGCRVQGMATARLAQLR
eukprot:7015076-Pyramimonas_sp.AAC.1